jgi:hypothetical protein
MLVLEQAQNKQTPKVGGDLPNLELLVGRSAHSTLAGPFPRAATNPTRLHDESIAKTINI